jgi:predicted NUDIX family NTP pyrophosphohydrolase
MLDMYQCPRTTCVQTSEEEDVGEARSGRERGACIVAGPLLGLNQMRGRPGHIGTAYQTDPDVDSDERRPASPDDPSPPFGFFE